MIPSLRPAGDADRKPVFALYESLFRHHIEQNWGWDDDWQRHKFASDWVETPPEIIECDGPLAGYLQTEWRQGSDPDPAHLFLLILGLKPEFQRRGIGSQVMEEVMRRATDRDAAVRLFVFHSNPDAMRFYQRHGFHPEESNENGVTMIWKSDSD